MTLDSKQRESIRQFTGKLYQLAGTVNDGENIASKAYFCGLTIDQVQQVLNIIESQR